MSEGCGERTRNSKDGTLILISIPEGCDFICLVDSNISIILNRYTKNAIKGCNESEIRN